jgi:hypothetical protein
MTPKHCLSILVGLLVLAATGAGVAGAQSTGAPHLAKKAPFLGRISGGAGVNYQFDRTPGKQTVTISGRKATVHLVGVASDHEYNATIDRGGLKAGDQLRVVITALARDGKTKLTYNKVMYLHRSLNRPQTG